MSPPPLPSLSSPPIVSIQSGPVAGIQIQHHKGHNVNVFRGIPYALPPTGERRFKAPVEEVPIWNGIRDATIWGAKAMQVINTNSSGGFFGLKRDNPGDNVDEDPEATKRRTGGSPGVSEDCLFVNVTAPAETPAAGAPIMVWIHGGGFVSGSGNDIGDGLNFATKHGIIFVSFNYRLGALGFLNLAPILREEYKDSGNVGLLDQIAALRWVQRNISAFGGDPARVTITGISAGAKSVVTLMAMPSAKGLFARAICESGGGDRAANSAITSATTAELLAQLSLPSPTDILTTSATQLVQAAESLPSVGPTRNTWVWLPTIDGTVLPDLPITAIAAGAAAHVPLLVGSNANEAATYTVLDPTTPSHARPLLRVTLVAATAERLIARYEAWKPGAAPRDIDREIMTDERYGVATLRLADAQSLWAPTYRYYFTAGVPGLPGFLRAGHGMEVPFVFDLIPRGAPVAAGELARVMGEYWAGFVVGRRPLGILEWPVYERVERWTMVFGEDGAEVVGNPTAERHAAWEGVSFETNRWYQFV